jgi:hypothetical protein
MKNLTNSEMAQLGLCKPKIRQREAKYGLEIILSNKKDK